MSEGKETIVREPVRYRVDRLIGRGGMGVVYQGYDTRLHRDVAIKKLNKALLASEYGNEYLERFRREAQAAANLDHPNIVSIYDYGDEDGDPYIVMELLAGQDLDALIEAGQRPSTVQSIDLVNQVLDALAHCHNKGVIHRDIKPANIFLLPDGRIKLTDFGIARVQGSKLTQIGASIGTPAYMAPEQDGDQADARGDLYSVGVVLYELLTGDLPPRSQASAKPSPPIGAAAERVLTQALAELPTERFQDAEAFKAALSSLTWETSRGKRSRWPIMARLAIAFAAIVVSAIHVWRFTDESGGKGVVHIASYPPGATVCAAQRRLGVTPLSIELPSGNHTLVLKRAGYEALELSLEVRQDVPIDIELPLSPRSSDHPTSGVSDCRADAPE